MTGGIKILEHPTLVLLVKIFEIIVDILGGLLPQQLLQYYYLLHSDDLEAPFVWPSL